MPKIPAPVMGAKFDYSHKYVIEFLICLVFCKTAVLNFFSDFRVATQEAPTQVYSCKF